VKGSVSIASQQALSAPGLAMMVQPTVLGGSQDVTATFASTDNNLGPTFGIVLRYQDSQNYYLAYRHTGGTSALIISKFERGVETKLTSGSGVPIANPTKLVPFTLRATANANTISLYLDGVLKARVTDSTYGSGAVGMVFGSTRAGLSHMADNFTSSLVAAFAPETTNVGSARSSDLLGSVIDAVASILDSASGALDSLTTLITP